MHPQARDMLQRFWDTTNARDWAGLAGLLHPDVVYRVPQTRERTTGREAFLDVFRTWPGDWVVQVQTLIAAGDEGVTTIAFLVDGTTETGISFFRLADGLITEIVDYWPSPCEPPPRASVHLRRS
jgi:ketosteroid isomerase-like protein